MRLLRTLLLSTSRPVGSSCGRGQFHRAKGYRPLQASDPLSLFYQLFPCHRLGYLFILSKLAPLSLVPFSDDLVLLRD
jgi:hypothetical protein